MSRKFTYYLLLITHYFFQLVAVPYKNLICCIYGAVRGKISMTRFINLTGWNGSHTQVPRTARLKSFINFFNYELRITNYELRIIGCCPGKGGATG
ncbi:hypothetical protein NIES2107_70530 (plasmid) [Nostoc carneum NIES-2107]|nr:hypothetical protein NIES2107_70530 [Nostoc carneum NIES-2107]